MSNFMKSRVQEQHGMDKDMKIQTNYEPIGNPFERLFKYLQNLSINF